MISHIKLICVTVSGGQPRAADQVRSVSLSAGRELNLLIEAKTVQASAEVSGKGKVTVIKVDVKITHDRNIRREREMRGE